jgi:hypothetical protein
MAALTCSTALSSILKVTLHQSLHLQLNNLVLWIVILPTVVFIPVGIDEF